MIEYLNNLDAAVLLWLNGFHNAFFDIFMDLVSNKWMWTPMYFSIFIVCLLHTKLQPKLLVILALFGITFALSDYTCAEIIRPLVNRPRPSNFESGIGHLVHIVHDYRGGRYGFPSCHAANSFMLATLGMLVFKEKHFTIFLYSWAFLHTYSRIYLGVHYPGDTIIGAFVGCALAWGCYCICIRLYPLSDGYRYRYLRWVEITGIIILFVLFAAAGYLSWC